MTRTINLPILAACLLLSITARSATPLDTGDTFPPFALKQSDGTTWRLADHQGQPKVVLFWATWCPYCRKLMPGIVALHDEFAGQGLAIVAVNFRDDDGDTDAYARELGMAFPIVLDGDGLAADIGVHGTPTLFVLDRDDRVRLRTSTSDPTDARLRSAVTAAVVTAAP